MTTPPFVYQPVPKHWPSSTIVVIANGPSLTHADVDQCRGQHVIAVKNAVTLAPWADVLYGCDAKWWTGYPETKAFTGLKYRLGNASGCPAVLPTRPDAIPLRFTGDTGLELDPSGLKGYGNSGGQAINLAVHLGATRILLLGFDMQRHNASGKHRWHGDHPYGKTVPAYNVFALYMPSIVTPLKTLGVEVINCSRDTALTYFRRATLADALAEVSCAA